MAMRGSGLVVASWAAMAGSLYPVDVPGKVWLEGLPEYRPRVDAGRADVPEIFKWNLSDMFESPRAWENEFASLEASVPTLAGCKGRLMEEAKTLQSCLDQLYGLQERLDRLVAYANAVYSTDRTDNEAKARVDRALALSTRFAEVASYVEPELLQAPPEKLRRYVASRPGLAKYRHFVDDLLRRRPHVLSAKEERILALSRLVRSGPYLMLNALEEDVQFPRVHDEEGREVVLTRANFPKFRASTSREVREEAVRAFFSTLRKFSRSFAASLDMAVKANVFAARARGYSSALEASLDRNAVPVQVYEKLLEVVHENLETTLHRYVALRKEIMGVTELHYYDLYNPLFPAPDKDVAYVKAAQMVVEALTPLGDDYVTVLERGLDPRNGWVDIFPNKGKRSGAYCNATYGNHPIVFLNYMNQLEDAFAVAHEYGHAMHFYLAYENQPYVNADPPIFVAEIASTFNEEMLLEYLLRQTTDPKERLYLLNRRLENIRTTVLRQAMFAEFEQAIYAEVEKGGALTNERAAQIYEGLIRKYYGPEFAVGPDDGYEWAYVPHFYYDFYVYQYATGLMSAIALSQKILSGEKGSVERYLAFLKAGGSDYPLDMLQAAGVDLTKSEPMQATFDLFRRTLKDMEHAFRQLQGPRKG